MALDDEVAAQALEVALTELRRRMAASDPQQIEAQLAAVDAKIARALDLAIEHGDDVVREKLSELKGQRDTLARARAELRLEIPTADELKPRLRERLHDLEAALCAGLASGRLTLGALFGEQRMRVHRNGRIEGVATLQPDEKLPASPRSARAGSCDGSGGALRHRGLLARRRDRGGVPDRRVSV